MTSGSETRVFQCVVCIAAIIPLTAGAAGALIGPTMIHGVSKPSADLESHFSYLSGLLFGIGTAFVFSIIELRSRALLFQALGLIVVLGGVARLFALMRVGLPGLGHWFAFVMELGVVPLLLLWHRRILRRVNSTGEIGSI